MTADQERRVHPFRGEAAPMPDADTGVRFVRALWGQAPMPGGVAFASAWRGGVAHAGELADPMRRAIAVLEDPNAPAEAPEVEAVILAMLDYANRRGLVIKEAQGGANDRYYPVDAWLVRRWLAAGGGTFALRVLVAFARLDVARAGTDPSNITASVTRRTEEHWGCLDAGHLGIFHVLRRALATADDAGAIEEARRIRANASLPMRCAIAFTFPDEPFWEDDLRALTPAKKSARLPPAAWALATTRIGEDALGAVLDSMARDPQPFVTDTALYGYTLVHRFGDAAARHLVAYLRVTKDPWAKEMMGDALALTRTEDARAFFVEKVKDKALGPIAKRYLDA
jgi:hypothetical protein